MEIYGIDFTSTPNKRKPITCARCHFDGEALALATNEALQTFESFEQFLARPGPWVAGMDFPFGQPRTLVENIGWPKTWDGCVRHIGEMSREEFVGTLAAYRQGRAKGDKHHLRETDRRAKSRSPMMLYGVPVGKMFFEGAPRLLGSGVAIPPCHANGDARTVVEAYPALVARRWAGGRSYKADYIPKQTEDRRMARQDIVRGLRAEAQRHFGFEVRVDDGAAEACIQDGSGDQLDALLSAIQAAWSYGQREDNWGIPGECDPLEGWIVDPALVSDEMTRDRPSY